MAKVSISEAAKRFDVSRPTLLKHLKSGKISGAKEDGKGWQIDTSELVRTYQPRTTSGDKALAETLPSVAMAVDAELQAENERLRRELSVAQALAEERGRRLDQLVPLLTALRPTQPPAAAPEAKRPRLLRWWRRL